MELGPWDKGDKEGRNLSLSCSADDSSDKMVPSDVGRAGAAKSEKTGWARESDL